MLKKVAPGTASRLTLVDHNETYGRHILEKNLIGLNISQCIDLGCGYGDDLLIVKKNNPKARLIGIDYGNWNERRLKERDIEPISINIENQKLPFEDESIDFLIANQVLEHTKEIFWINHEVFRVLSIGGYLYLGVPNVLSLHNRILGFLGIHPTCSKLVSAHVRSFSKKDTFLFYRTIASQFSTIKKFDGSQFYPFPKKISRTLSNTFPSLSFSIFFLIKKTDKYNGEFIEWLSNNTIETNFYRGEDA
jgi:ubiquinone/menaquinone biosynthesis C-methylase UbiE